MEKSTSVLKSKHFSAFQQALQESFRFGDLTVTKVVWNRFYCFSLLQPKWVKPTEWVPAASDTHSTQLNLLKDTHQKAERPARTFMFFHS